MALSPSRGAVGVPMRHRRTAACAARVHPVPRLAGPSDVPERRAGRHGGTAPSALTVAQLDGLWGSGGPDGTRAPSAVGRASRPLDRGIGRGIEDLARPHLSSRVHGPPSRIDSPLDHRPPAAGQLSHLFPYFPSPRRGGAVREGVCGSTSPQRARQTHPRPPRFGAREPIGSLPGGPIPRPSGVPAWDQNPLTPPSRARGVGVGGTGEVVASWRGGGPARRPRGGGRRRGACRSAWSRRWRGRATPAHRGRRRRRAACASRTNGGGCAA